MTITAEAKRAHGRRSMNQMLADRRAAKEEGMAYARWWREAHRHVDWAAVLAAEARANPA